MGADSHVVLLAAIRGEHRALAGDKASALAGLLRAGFAVPPGFVVTSEAFTAYLDAANLSDKLSRLLADSDFADHAALARTSEEATRLILASGEQPQTPLADAVRAAYARIAVGRVAVRSSVAAGENAAAPIPGSRVAALNVSGADGVMGALRTGWAALFEPQALRYRAQCGDERRIPSIAVVVQRMVQSARSGMAYTIDPVSQAHDTIVIEALYGLASGGVTPDMYTVDKTSLAVIERTVVDQPREVVCAAVASDDGIHLNEWRAIPAERRTRPKLDDGQIGRLSEMARRIERHCGTPQSVAWAEEDGELYVLGSRPVMALAHTH